jgi:hypothetical protein
VAGPIARRFDRASHAIFQICSFKLKRRETIPIQTFEEWSAIIGMTTSGAKQPFMALHVRTLGIGGLFQCFHKPSLFPSPIAIP